MVGRFEIYKDVGGQYRFRLKGRNGEIVASGESYPTKAAGEEGRAGGPASRRRCQSRGPKK